MEDRLVFLRNSFRHAISPATSRLLAICRVAMPWGRRATPVAGVPRDVQYFDCLRHLPMAG